MNVLWVATKLPWPPADGGRLIAANTIEALAAAGHEMTVIAPALDDRAVGAAPPGVRLIAVEASLRSLPVAALSAFFRRTPVSVARHAHLAVREAVERHLRSEAVSVVHAEQVQALAQCQPAFDLGRPVVFRAQNVESDLVAGAWSSRLLAALARREAARLARFEGDAVRRASVALALCEEDRARLEALAGGSTRVRVLPAPVVDRLPAADRALPGRPAVVLMGSPRWKPNQRGAEWFAAEAWPRVHAALPGARLHVFGLGEGGGTKWAGAGIDLHAAPADSREAFPPGAILVVPLDLASGIRMKILEAWARGVPVVATPAAASGLEAEDGRELLLASGAEGFAAALSRLVAEPGLGPALTAAGRELLRRRHAPSAVADTLAGIYAELPGAKRSVQAFYDDHGWRFDESNDAFADGAEFDDLRPVTAAYRRRANERVREALQPPGKLILDAASGAVQYADYVSFSEGYRRRVCVDLSRRGLVAARQRLGEHGLFVQADVTGLPFAPAAFDAVVSLHTLYHVPADEQAAFLGEIARVLKPGRRAVVVSAWATSAWDLLLRAPGSVLRRLRGVGRRLALRPPPARPPVAAAAPSLYFHPTLRAWLAASLPADLRLEIRCWRSVSVDVLRQLTDRGGGGRATAGLAWLEDACPWLLGRLGVYPLLVLEKRAPQAGGEPEGTKKKS